MLNIVVALPEEARPVIHHYRLKRFHDINAFPVYGNEDIRLIVSGIGKLSSATATGYLSGINGSDESSAWINVGIAGSANIPVGQAVLAHQLIDDVSQQKFYPTIFFDTNLTTSTVTTVSSPQSEYLADSMCDMEATGFYSAALRFCSSELVHCLKIVSDNKSFHVDSVSKNIVVNLVEQNLEEIGRLSSLMLDNSRLLDAGNRGDDVRSHLNSKFHFTVSQQAQLTTLLQNWFAISELSPLDNIDLSAIKNAKTLLSKLQEKINKLSLSY